MADRILRVNAYTTFDLLEGTVEGHEFEEDAYAVLNVKTARKDPEDVELQVELDNTDIDEVPPHADTVTLSPADARELAAELESAAETVERAQDQS